MIAKDVRNFMKRFERTTAALARGGRKPEFEARFGDFHKLLGAWLEVAPPGASPPDHFFGIVGQFGGPFEIDLRSIALAAVESGDSGTVVAFVDELAKAAFMCDRHSQPRFMEVFLRILVFLYYQCIESTELSEAVGSRLDSFLHSMLSSVRSDRSESTDQNAGGWTSRAGFQEVLRFSLDLVQATIRYEQATQASYFVERIFEHRRYRESRHFAEEFDAEDPEVVIDFVAIVLAGWALHVLQSEVLEEPAAARQVLSAALSQVPAVEVLVAEWELFRGAGRHDSAIDSRLGIANWDVRDWKEEFRPGVTVARWGEADWVRLGLRAALLRNDARLFGDTSDLFTEQPRRFIWDEKVEREALTNLAADRWLGIPEDTRSDRVDSAMSIISARARSANVEYLRYVFTSELSKRRVVRFEEDAIGGLESKRAWIRAFRHSGISERQAQLVPFPAKWWKWMPKEYLLDDNNWGSGFGKHLGEQTGNREAMELLHAIETSVPSSGQIESLATLPETVRTVRRALIDAGYQPNILVLPKESRFAGALFRKPLWQVEGRREFGEASIGVWEQLHVLRFPYIDPSSILLLDSTRLLANHEVVPGNLDIDIWVEEEPDNKEAEAKRQGARAALDDPAVAVPESSSILVLGWMKVLPSLGCVDIRAGRAIGISESDNGYAIIEGSDLYHRPTCPDIEHEDPDYVLHMKRDASRKPCPTCRPDRWNTEGRSGKIPDQEQAED